MNNHHHDQPRDLYHRTYRALRMKRNEPSSAAQETICVAYAQMNPGIYHRANASLYDRDAVDYLSLPLTTRAKILFPRAMASEGSRRFFHQNKNVVKGYTREYDPDCPACLRNLRHTQAEHEAALRRVYEASRGDLRKES